MIKPKDATINILSLVISAIVLVFSIISFIISYHQTNRQIFIEATGNQPILDVSYKLDDENIDITIRNRGSKIVISQIDFNLAFMVDIYHTSDLQFKGRYLINLNSDKLRYETLKENEWKIHISNYSNLQDFWDTSMYVYTLQTIIMVPRIDIIYLNIHNQEDSRIFTYYEGCKLNDNYTLYETSELAYDNFLTDYYTNNYKNGLYDFHAATFPFQKNHITVIGWILILNDFFNKNGLPVIDFPDNVDLDALRQSSIPKSVNTEDDREIHNELIEGYE